MTNKHRWFYKRNKNLTVYYITARMLCYLGIHSGTVMEDRDGGFVSCDWCLIDKKYDLLKDERMKKLFGAWKE